ncbi:M56 family metallopeptidase, partial [Desulfosporosinus sp. OT]|uniref:M56 family metallopeptidase n=1 Tax=Desulfosporosinus sp. OT TaxID=913865 RepID=UPI000223A537
MSTILQANYLNFFNWVLITSAKASIFIIFLMGVKFVFRHKIGARFQYLLWSVLIIGLMLPWTPNSSASVYNYLDSSQILHIIASNFDGTTQPSFTNDGNKQFDLIQTNVMNSNFNKAIISTKTQMLNDDTPFIYKVMCFIWFLGVLILTVITVIVNIRFSHRIEHALVTEQRLLSEFNKLKAELKITAEISLLKSECVKSPSLLGLIHPRLLLPIGIEQTFSLEQISHIFLHELIHYKRKDLWINWLTQILIISHWFNPLIWYAFYRMREDQEISCDALVTSRIDAEQSSNYAYTLVKLAETYSTAPRISSFASLCGSNSQIKKRLISLSNRKHQQASAKWSLLGGLMIALMAFATFASAQVDANPVLEDGQKNKVSQGNSGGQVVGAAKGVVDSSSGIMVEDITGP